ncbi:MAG: DNA-directed RNA polymerase subunit alpha [Nitrospinota bacterium]|nr:DNA-directed RNA polymerase subunit alpha [Nitrospinota bacterium]MDH5755536.1 DNA-directed RNA polymerase subunit alpha [Nitrospinota bacterium]
MWKGLVKPKKLEFDQKKQTDEFGVMTAEPFERGFGVTIGNSLRRLMLSSIVGNAVVAVKFEGIHHEFSTIDGVVEDVSDIILNIKQLIVRKHTPEDRTIVLSIKGKGEYTAAAIETTPDVEILNKDLHIVTITDDKASLRAEMVVRSGRGYSPAEENADPNWDIAMIPIDAVFSPVRKVTYRVEETRVEQSSNYDKLILEIHTNGAVRPNDALTQAAKNLKDHLSLFISTEEEVEPVMQTVNEEKMKVALSLRKSVDELELSVRSFNCLKNANIKSIFELVKKTDQDMLKTRNFGRKSLNEIKEILEEMGLSLGMNVENYRDELTAIEQGGAAKPL